MSTVLNPAGASASSAHQTPSTRQMAPFLAANFAAMSSNYAFVAVAGALARLLELRAWHLGAVIAMVGSLWVASSPGWGRLTDRIGHAAALRRALAGVVLAFAALAAYLQWALAQPALPATALSLAVLLISRAVAGVCTAGVPVASIAWIAGRTEPSARAAAMARYGAAGAAGMVVAPPLAGWLGGIGLPAALWLAALLPLLPLLPLAWMQAPAAGAAPRTPAPRLRPHDARIRLPWLSALTLYSVVIMANVCIGFYLIDHLRATPAGATAAAGTALGAAGLALVLSQTVAARLPRVAPIAWLRGGAVLAGLGFGSLLLVVQPWMVTISFFVAGCGMGMAFPAVSALAANSVQPQEQSACAAAMSMAQGASMIAAPVLGTVLYDLAPRAPFVLMPALLAAVLMGALRRSSHGR